ncbi:MAG: DotU family type IV/VI secretion system protein [Desulfobacterales bacterium]|nr:DotU family type IV/VI secretion system protein [Desulfobacterales bacterium]
MRLTDCFLELIAYVAYFLKNAADRQPAFDQVKADIQRLISESQDSLKKGNLSAEDYDLARFAIFAWIDEAILNSGWNEKDKWQREQLQRIYYRTADAGEIFFERLNAVGPHQRDVREVYYLCLAMGFMGRYCREGDEYLLDQLKTSNLKLIMGSSMGLGALTEELFPEAYPVESSTAGVGKVKNRFSFFTILCLGFPVVLYGVLFLIYRFILSNIGENLLSTVQ